MFLCCTVYRQKLSMRVSIIDALVLPELKMMKRKKLLETRESMNRNVKPPAAAMTPSLSSVLALATPVRRASPKMTLGRAFLAIAVALQALLGVSAPVKPAAAQSACTTRSQAVKSLSETYSEAQVAAGIASNGRLVEVFTSANGATWTIIFTMPNGTSCLVASGEGWISVPPRLSLGRGL